MQTVRTLAKGQVVIPMQLRKLLSIGVGDLLEIAVVDGHIELRPLPADPIAAFAGSLRGGESLAQGLEDEHRHEVEGDASR
ncbi:MAG: AbrB/MazE/SpoVT family DNA-binding domain-containing protein [Candidatus Methylophosphatis roskildensis]|nr:AbrB/MazE/SpoVT family DNA-binding domain-containing protein [Sterolibacteriaceae bacterium]MBK9084033.1 AbrB/MazE/SpoVT family DNA-binding domain-containing protein [Sterolibacteriaceae bacterium]